MKEQKKELLRKSDTLAQATYEFYFEHKGDKKDNSLKQQFDSAVKVLRKLIELGVDTGEFQCEDPEGTARNIMYVLEGLRICAQTRGITPETVDKELLYIFSNLGMDE